MMMSTPSIRLANISMYMMNLTYNQASVLDRHQMKVISIINIITASLSLLGAASIIFCSIVRKKACLAEVFPIFQLSLADLLAATMMITGAGLYLSDPVNPLNLGYKMSVCAIVSALTKCFYVNSFLLTTSYALEALLRIRLRFRNTQSRQHSNYQAQYFIYFLAWLLPVSATVIIVAMSSVDTFKSAPLHVIAKDCTLCLPIFHYSQDDCWANKRNGFKWLLAYRLLFLAPLLFTMFTNMVLYFCIFYSYRRSNISRGLLTFHQRKEEGSIRSKAILYQSMFAFCWIFSMVLGLIRMFDPDTNSMSNYYILFVVQSLTAPLQGFCNSLVYGWSRRGFKIAMQQSHLNFDVPTFYNSMSI